MSDRKPYTALGQIMDTLARRPPHNVRGPYRMSAYIKEKLGDAPTGVALSKWMYGEAHAKTEHLEMFVEAFELTEEEKVAVAWAYAYPKRAAA